MYGMQQFLNYWQALCCLLILGTTSYTKLYTQKQNHDFLIAQLQNPRVRAFLDTIAYAEGTLNKEGYGTMFTYKYFDDFSDHPRQVNFKLYKGKMLRSSAAGKYQFLRKTWDSLAPKIQAPSFEPLQQERAAVQLLIDKEALPLVLQGRFVPAIKKVNGVWASLPGAPYNQPTRSMKELKIVYKKLLILHKKNNRGGYV